jgi:hypothetical protein
MTTLDEIRARHFGGHTYEPGEYAVMLYEHAPADLAFLLGEVERLQKACNDDGLSSAAIAVIRELLTINNVPVAAFIDDHVGNAIVQRNQALERAERAERERDAALAQLAELRQIAAALAGERGVFLPTIRQQDKGEPR